MIAAATQHRIEQALDHGDIVRAAAFAETALAAGEVDPLLLNLAAWAREEAEDFDGAAALLDRALALVPGDPLILVAMAANLRKQGRLAEAIRAADTAARAQPDNAAVWLERGFILEAGNSLAAARDSYARAAHLDPGMAPALAGVATVAARTGDREAVRTFGERALAIEPGNVSAAAALARAAIESGDAAAAITRLQRFAEVPLPAGQRLLVEGLRGDALAKLGQPAAAFAAYDAANRAWAAQHARLMPPGAASHRDQVEAIIAAVANTPPSPPLALPPVAGAAATHIFLCGYPRSGNTLAENILASLPGAEAIEERPTIPDADAWLTPDGIARLTAIGASEAQALRTAYWRKVAACGVGPSPALLIDMDPLKSVQLPLIARLFPAARVVLLRRDPRDVVWSCFHTGFAPNAATFEFSDLERAARHYDAVMRLTALCLATLPLTVEIVRYEALVADFDATTRALCDFVGAEWTPALRSFDRTAARRGVSTASVGQVRQGLYDGSGQWRPFAEQLAPILPILAPWVERYGYAD